MKKSVTSIILYLVFFSMIFSLNSCSKNVEQKKDNNTLSIIQEQEESLDRNTIELLNSNGKLNNIDYKTLLQKVSRIDKMSGFEDLKEIFGIFPKYVLETGICYSIYYSNEYIVEIFGICPIFRVVITNNMSNETVYKIEF